MNSMIFLFWAILQFLALIGVIALVIRFWNLCDAVQELNRNVQLMAYDLKDLRSRLAGPPTTTQGTETQNG